ncbi:MAG: SUF system NifU family Fe-S cluster assembly protein [Candidatus Pristimantibacillus lignocellulolyticus]|uniref:SUF system NifU family Fe-S cluster assembly protein n=1 Tax=Candidatus Pristimantibacillus lignocellulolyticus TaxID=2994561 RepID=A0A9J6ZES5_9BACL|nr:MAG: SUF system NifU family Fe-S cluster assembly protein [Candidatus Pristimantibacillus lignocellulolyticus]
MELNDLYRRVIMDHYKNPRNRGEMQDESVAIQLNNPTCGDRISLQLQLENGIVTDAKYTGEGCSISMSSASMMTEAVKGLKYEEALALAERFSSLMKGADEEFEELEDIEALSGVNKFPARIKCATLAWNALRKGIESQK